MSGPKTLRAMIEACNGWDPIVDLAIADALGFYPYIVSDNFRFGSAYYTTRIRRPGEKHYRSCPQFTREPDDAINHTVRKDRRVLIDSDPDRNPHWRCLVRPAGAHGDSRDGYMHNMLAAAIALAGLADRELLGLKPRIWSERFE